MYSKAVCLFSTFFLILFYARSQNCLLDIGVNSEAITKIFQLNAEQVSKMEEFRGKLELELKVINEDIQKLFKDHPQKTQEELTALAEKYKALQKKMVQVSLDGDTKLLSLFNRKQYDRYLTLCEEASRDPIKVVPLALPPE